MQTQKLLVAIMLLTSAFAFAQYLPKQSEYAELVSQATSGDRNVDFQRLRLSYAESPERHHARDTEKEEKSMFAAFNAKDYEKALTDANLVIANQFVNADAHYVAYIAHSKLQHVQQAEFHKSIFSGLLKSILDSGDGATARTAWIVISIQEEYAVLRLLGLKPSKQSLSHLDGHAFDLIECRDPKSDGALTVYFNVDIPMLHSLR
jgi:hypothetical protein